MQTLIFWSVIVEILVIALERGKARCPILHEDPSNQSLYNNPFGSLIVLQFLHRVSTLAPLMKTHLNTTQCIGETQSYAQCPRPRSLFLFHPCTSTLYPLLLLFQMLRTTSSFSFPSFHLNPIPSSPLPNVTEDVLFSFFILPPQPHRFLDPSPI